MPEESKEESTSIKEGTQKPHTELYSKEKQPMTIGPGRAQMGEKMEKTSNQESKAPSESHKESAEHLMTAECKKAVES